MPALSNERRLGPRQALDGSLLEWATAFLRMGRMGTEEDARINLF
jgi:hypothetical protein